MTSYQVNFASHHTHDRHVGFLFAHDGVEEHKLFRYFLFSSYYITKLQLRDKNISKHNRFKFKYVHEVNRCTKRKPSNAANRAHIGEYPRRANPLYEVILTQYQHAMMPRHVYMLLVTVKIECQLRYT